MKRHANIPVFIPHLGCPNQCVFCNQRKISGVSDFDPKELSTIIDNALSTISDDTEVEIAFFGGSFTGIDRGLMISLLETAYSYVEGGRVNSIRCSTRPDYIDEEVLGILKRYGVKVIELGLQSTSSEVLALTKRGHSYEDELRASRLIVEYGFSLVGQMMIGLPGSTLESELKTADFIIRVGASGARIYPTVVFHDTELSEMADSGIYKALSTDDAITRAAAVFERFTEAAVPVIRIGLCSSENLSSIDSYHSGPNHSALGELVINQYYYNRILRTASELNLSKTSVLKVTVSKGSVSKAVGQNKRNKNSLKENLGVADIRFSESDRVVGYEILLEVEEKTCI